MGALLREVAEELGGATCKLIQSRRKALEEVCHLKKKDKEVYTYALELDFPFIKKVQLGPSSGGLQLVSKEDVKNVRNLLVFDRDGGIENSYIIAMFPDELQALKEAFAIYE